MARRKKEGIKLKIYFLFGLSFLAALSFEESLIMTLEEFYDIIILEIVTE